MDPTSTPKKRTALGRFKHEGAESIVAKSGKVVFYLGDDERFDYVYKFVTDGTFNPADRKANMDLLDKGTLYVAKFGEDGSMQWLPLVHGQGPLTEQNGFKSQADVLIETRKAGDLLGPPRWTAGRHSAERCERQGLRHVDQQHQAQGGPGQCRQSRAENAFGHIIEITENDGDFAATFGKWEVLLKCGDPSVAAVGATFSTETTKNGWFGMPDNCAVDSAGRLWVATDGNSPKGTGRTDGLGVDTEGSARATSKLFFRVPVGAEMCGPLFTPDDETAFVAVQHPGDGGEDWAGHGRHPITRISPLAGRISSRICQPVRRLSPSPRSAAARSLYNPYASRLRARLSAELSYPCSKHPGRKTGSHFCWKLLYLPIATAPAATIRQAIMRLGVSVSPRNSRPMIMAKTTLVSRMAVIGPAGPME